MTMAGPGMQRIVGVLPRSGYLFEFAPQRTLEEGTAQRDNKSGMTSSPLVDWLV